MQTPSIYKEIGRRIRTRRYECGLSQAQLAECVGQNRCSLTQIELGKQKVAVHELLAIAEALGVSIGCLLSDWTPQEKLVMRTPFTQATNHLMNLIDCDPDDREPIRIFLEAFAAHILLHTTPAAGSSH